MYTALFYYRFGWRCWSYLWARSWWDNAFVGYFSRNIQSTQGLIKRKVAATKIMEVGDLIVDWVNLQVPDLPERDSNLITLLPGSREEEIRHLLPFLGRVAEILRETRPELQFQAALSPFITLARLSQLLKQPVDPRIDHAGGLLHNDRYVCKYGLEIPIVQNNALLHTARSSLALSVPGTKTAEAATLGVPCLTIVPLNCPEFLPTHGLLGLLDWIPGGSRYKGKVLLRSKGRVGLLAQPNQLLGQALMPEMIDILTARDVAQQAAHLLSQPQELQGKSLLLRQAFQKLRGCSYKILDQLGG